MDELSWRAQLAKSNINILNLSWNDDNTVVDVFFEFMYHPYSGSTKWCKTWTSVAGSLIEKGPNDEPTQSIVTGNKIASDLKKEVLSLRKELED